MFLKALANVFVLNYIWRGFDIENIYDQEPYAIDFNC